MEGNRRDSPRPSVQGGIAQWRTPLLDISARQLQRVNNSADNGRQVSVASAKPWFRLGAHALMLPHS
jgi:hypothetical protein